MWSNIFTSLTSGHFAGRTRDWMTMLYRLARPLGKQNYWTEKSWTTDLQTYKKPFYIDVLFLVCTGGRHVSCKHATSPPRLSQARTSFRSSRRSGNYIQKWHFADFIYHYWTTVTTFTAIGRKGNDWKLNNRNLLKSFAIHVTHLYHNFIASIWDQHRKPRTFLL